MAVDEARRRQQDTRGASPPPQQQYRDDHQGGRGRGGLGGGLAASPRVVARDARSRKAAYAEELRQQMASQEARRVRLDQDARDVSPPRRGQEPFNDHNSNGNDNNGNNNGGGGGVNRDGLGDAAEVRKLRERAAYAADLEAQIIERKGK